MKDLYDAIKDHCDLEDSVMIDAANHGAASGFGGFTYYADTVKFYDENEKLIVEYLDEMADGMGFDSGFAYVASLPAIKNVGNIDQFKNLCSWIILEEVGRWVEDGNGTDEDEEED